MIPDEIKKYIENKQTISSFKLKNKLLKFKLKEHKCESCGKDTWNGLPISLELHHVDGDNKNNNLSNLKLICPNCHAQTNNFRGKNIGISNRPRISDSEYKEAIESNINIRQACIALNIVPKGGNYAVIRNAMRRLNASFRKISESERIEKNPIKKEKSKAPKKNRNKYATKEEAILASRKVKNRPSKQELLEMAWRMSVAKIGKSYEVSDKAIRNWATQYKIPVPPIGYWRKFAVGKTEECKKIKSELFKEFGF